MTTKTTHSETRSARRHILLIGAFFVLLWLPLADNLLRVDPTRPTDENRALAPPPLMEWSEQAVKEFPRRFGSWYDDHFGLRNFLVRQYHSVHFGWLGIADPEKVIKGKDGWLYLGRKTLIDEARGLKPMAKEEIEAWVEKIDAIRRWQETRGGTFLLALVPDKHRVFPESLPGWFVPSEERRKEQLMDALAPTGMNVLDLSDAMASAKSASEYPVWLKTDTHWTGVGAYYGYRAIFERLNLTPVPIDELVLADTPPKRDGAWHNSGNLAGLLGVRDLVPESWVGFLPQRNRATPTTEYPPPTRRVSGVNVPYATTIDDDSLSTALVIGGSFRWALMPLLSEHFRRVVYTDFRYCFFDETMATAEAPDILLFVMTERQLLWFPTPPKESTW
jgi:alginate O-acetyltransferase complex protein AlgJ